MISYTCKRIINLQPWDVYHSFKLWTHDCITSRNNIADAAWFLLIKKEEEEKKQQQQKRDQLPIQPKSNK